MNWLLPVVAVFLALSAWDGHRQGFIKKLVGIVSLVLTLVVTAAASPLVAEALKEHTGLRETLENSISAGGTELLETFRSLGLEEVVSGYLADQILQALAVLITLLLVGVLVRGIAFALGLASRLPVLHGLNKTAGLVFGLAEGVVLVWIFFFVITVFSTTEWGGRLLTMVSDSGLLSFLAFAALAIANPSFVKVYAAMVIMMISPCTFATCRIEET